MQGAQRLSVATALQRRMAQRFIHDVGMAIFRLRRFIGAFRHVLVFAQRNCFHLALSHPRKVSDLRTASARFCPSAKSYSLPLSSPVLH